MNELKKKLTVYLTTQPVLNAVQLAIRIMMKSIRIESFSFKPFVSIVIITLFLAQAVPSFAVLVKLTNYDSSRQMVAYYTYEYNTSGQMSKSSSYNASSQRTGYGIYEYNASGLQSKSSSYNASGQLTYYGTSEYNASGLMTKSSSYNASGLLQSYMTIEYNTSGLRLKDLSYNASGQLISYTVNEYNASGRISKYSIYYAGQLDFYSTFEYNISGQNSRVSFYNASGQLTAYSTSEYNVSGQISKYSYYYAGRLQSYNAYEYNASGQMSKVSAYNASGQLSGYAVYEYSDETTVATPSFSPVSGTYTTTRSVTLSCTTPGATIRYTTDNTEPNASSAVYISPIGVSATTTIKAKGFKGGLTASATATGFYTMPVSNRPVILFDYGNFDPRTNQFGFTIIGATNMVIVVEACTDLADAAWFPLQTNTLTGGSFYFSDPRWTNYPGRFYRLRSP